MLDVRLKDIRRLEKEVLNYEAQEIVTGKILFYGDSGFTRWSTLPVAAQLRAMLPVLGGISGSTSTMCNAIMALLSLVSVNQKQHQYYISMAGQKQGKTG